MEDDPFTHLASYLTKTQGKTFSRNVPQAMYAITASKCLLVQPSQMTCRLLCDTPSDHWWLPTVSPITCSANGTFDVERLCCFKKSFSSENKVTFFVVPCLLAYLVFE